MNSKLKVAVYTICKNEESFVDRWANSNTEADLRLVCDTGSTDTTVDKLEAHGVVVHNISIQPWRFDLARSAALNLLPGDIDVCIWQDLDEELLPGWRQELDNKWMPTATTANHRYRHNNGAWTWHSKIHTRHHCRWTGAVHETLAWSVPEYTIELSEFYLDEHQDITKPRSNYLNLLLKKIAEGDTNWRTHYFLSNDYLSINSMDQAIEHKKISYDLCKEGPVVKSYIARNIARHYADTGNTVEAEKWFADSVSQSKERESWFGLCQYYYQQKQWSNCYLAATTCIGIGEQRTGFTYDPEAWGYLPYDYAAIAAHNLGMYNRAIEHGQQAVDLNPTDQRLKTNLKFYEQN